MIKNNNSEVDEKIYWVANDLYNLNNHYFLIKNYHYILHHVYFSNILFKNTAINITILRKPILRLISHYHFFDYKTYGYDNLIEFKEKEESLFKHYCVTIGNLYFQKFSNQYYNFNNQSIYKLYLLLIKLNKDDKFINKIISTLDKFDFVLILENLKLEKINKFFNNCETISLNYLNLNNNKYTYTNEFLLEIDEYLFFDNKIYNYFNNKN